MTELPTLGEKEKQETTETPDVVNMSIGGTSRTIIINAETGDLEVVNPWQSTTCSPLLLGD